MNASSGVCWVCSLNCFSNQLVLCSCEQGTNTSWWLGMSCCVTSVADLLLMSPAAQAVGVLAGPPSSGVGCKQTKKHSVLHGTEAKGLF